MAEEFHGTNNARTRKEFAAACEGIPLTFEPHIDFKKRVPHAIGLQLRRYYPVRQYNSGVSRVVGKGITLLKQFLCQSQGGRTK